ncbi:hypothetical protein [Dyadobacter sp. 676]|uniref:Quinol oxidase subunit 4 n=1 Tax=Dyadobacter sp. 676 TaxID=3088362 RepID=A0AAU8FGU7_9BACT
MKKSIIIGTAAGVILFLLVISCGRRMQASDQKTEQSDVAKKNKTEGYFYHQPEQDTRTDSSRIRKNINN